MEQKSNTKRLVVLAFLYRTGDHPHQVLLDPDTDRANRIRISAGCYDGDFIRSDLGRDRICYRRFAGHADLPISSVLPGIYPDGVFDRNDIRVLPQGKRDHLEKRTACQPARDPGMQSVSGYVMALHFDG